MSVTFTKDSGDPGLVDENWQRVVVKNATLADVTGTGWDVGFMCEHAGDVYFESPWGTWVGDTMTISGTSLTFLNDGVYSLEVSMMSNPLVWDTVPPPLGNVVPGTFAAYNISVGPPVVSTPASSPWSLAVLGIGALGALAWVGRRSVTIS